MLHDASNHSSRYTECTHKFSTTKKSRIHIKVTVFKAHGQRDSTVAEEGNPWLAGRINVDHGSSSENTQHSEKLATVSTAWACSDWSLRLPLPPNTYTTDDNNQGNNWKGWYAKSRHKWTEFLQGVSSRGYNIQSFWTPTKFHKDHI